jgi:hypothetical protein
VGGPGGALLDIRREATSAQEQRSKKNAYFHSTTKHELAKVSFPEFDTGPLETSLPD